jgi:hypothetical protein
MGVTDLLEKNTDAISAIMDLFSKSFQFSLSLTELKERPEESSVNNESTNIVIQVGNHEKEGKTPEGNGYVWLQTGGFVSGNGAIVGRLVAPEGQSI